VVDGRDRNSLLGGHVAVGTAPARCTRPRRRSPADLTVPRGRPDNFRWEPLAQFGGHEAVIYRSPDGCRVAAAFRESGTASFTYPFDEFLVVTSGSVEMHVHGGETFTLRTGDVAYLREGMTVDLKFSPDFSDLTCLVGDRPVKWR
jgi:uncharacterized cupin superfamily protein